MRRIYCEGNKIKRESERLPKERKSQKKYQLIGLLNYHDSNFLSKAVKSLIIYHVLLLLIKT